MPMPQLRERWETFGWMVWEMDGHNVDEVHKTLTEASESDYPGPRCIISHTVKGKGLPRIADRTESHYVKMDEEAYKQAVEQLEK